MAKSKKSLKPSKKLGGVKTLAEPVDGHTFR